MAPKALSTVLTRAAAAAADRSAVTEVLRESLFSDLRGQARRVAADRLDTVTAPEDWEPVVGVPHMRRAVALQLSPRIRVVLPSNSGDLMLVLGNDPKRWPVIQDIAHFGQLLQLHGLTG
jgi:hypothetical protein